MVVLVTGSGGQLGQALQLVSANHPDIDFVFCNSSTLDITNLQNCEAVFAETKPDFCINAAAYTAVDKAESEAEKAFDINVTGAKNIAVVCKEHHAILLHISTDFVFNGEKKSPYTEDDDTNPTGVYGQTKSDGEKAVQAIMDDYFIIRTSWVYSQFGNNFMKTMVRLGKEKDTLSVVNDQIGTPTNAVDLAKTLLAIIKSGKRDFGIYNFSNEGQCSWFDFARQIFEINDIQLDLRPIPTSAYPTPAKRPLFSVLDKNKIKQVFDLSIRHWEESLKNTPR